MQTVCRGVRVSRQPPFYKDFRTPKRVRVPLSLLQKEDPEGSLFCNQGRTEPETPDASPRETSCYNKPGFVLDGESLMQIPGLGEGEFYRIRQQKENAVSDYIMDLRKIVGHRPVLQVGASVIVEDAQERILLQLRKDNHCWGYPGGSVELDEVVEEAAKRELFEETGLHAEHMELFGIYSGRKLHYTYPNGDEVSNIDLVFLCRDYSGEMKMDEQEGDDLRFFSVEEVPDNISPPVRGAIEDWKKGKTEKRDYIRWIRSKVGHEQIILNFAAGCIKNGAGEILLQRRADRDVWGFPGGAVEVGESVEAAAVREIREETGLDVKVSKLIGVYSDYRDVYPNGDRAQTITTFFACDIIGGTLSADDAETLELRYFERHSVPPLVNKQHEDMMQDALHERYGVFR